MSITDLSLIGLVALALLFDYTNGFHDSANSVATVIATRVLKPRWAVLWAAFWNFIAFLIFGTAVANTVASVVKPDFNGLAVVFAALLGAVTWNYTSWHLGIPTSSSHALVGGLLGAGLAAGGTEAIKASAISKTAIFIVISPIAGLLIGGAIMLLLRVAVGKRDVAKTEKGFRAAQLVSSAAVSLGHGGNDAQKTMGVIAGLLLATGHLSQGPGDKLAIPLWVVLAAHTAIAAGTMSGGWRIVRTMGMSITTLRPVSGFAAETGAAVALFGSTFLGAPVSTTHTVAGSVSGVGLANRGTTTNWGVFRTMVIAWVVTMPIAALVSALAYWVTTKPPHAVSFVIMTVVLVTLVVLLAVALKHAPKASDVEPADEDQERQIPLRPGSGSVIDTGAGVPASAEGRAHQQQERSRSKAEDPNREGAPL